jgi:RNA polymerase-binding protein DksA
LAKTRSKSTPARKSAPKKKTTRKKVARKSAAKKTATNKKTTKKKTTKKKTTKKKTTQKKTTAAKKSTKKKPTTRKKSASKKVTKKKSAAKKPSKKKTTRKPAAAAKPAAPAKPVKLEDMTLEQRMELDWTPAKLRRVNSGLSRKDLLEYRAMLLEKRAEIVGDVKGMESARSASLDDLAHMPLHMADIGTDTFEQEFTLGLIESERRLLNEINDALRRMEDKTYGVCLASGQPIGKARLEFKPWAKYCIEVARLREKRGL